MRIVKIITGVVGALVLIIGGLIIYLANLDLNAHKESIRAEAKAATGGDFRLDGDLDLKLSLSPALEIRDVGVSNAAWGSQPEMATVGLMAVEVRVLDLVFGCIDITKLRLSDVELLLETDAQGRGNWQFTPPTPAANDRAAATTEEADAATDAQALSLGDVDLRRLRVVFADCKSGARHRFNVDHLRLRGGQGPLAVDFALTADGRPVDLAGTLPPLAVLGQPGSALPVKLAGTVDGQPLSLDGVLKLSQGAAGAFDAVTVPRLAASYGGLDLSGKMAVDLAGKRPAIDADLTVSAVDLHALPGVAADDGASSGSPGGASGGAGAGAAAADPLDQPLPVAALGHVDGKLKLHVAAIKQGALTVSDLRLDAVLRDSVLTLNPSTAAFFGGKVEFRGKLDGKEEIPTLKAVAAWRDGDFGALSRTLSGEDLLAARGTTTLDLVSRGATPRALLKAVDGRSVLISRDGRIKSRYWKLIALDLATEFEKLGNADEMQEMACAVARFDITGGVARSVVAMVDGKEITVAAEGDVNLGGQNLDLLITPAPKDPVVFSLAAPIRVKGPWADLSVLPDTVSVLKSLGAIGLGATVSPALLILPFMSTGSKEPPCDVAVAVAEGRAPPRVKKKQGVADAVKSLLPKLKDGEAQRGKVPDLKKLVPKSPKKLLDKLKLFGKD